MSVVGIDVSSKRIDLAWLDEQGRPQRWHQLLGKGDLIDRLRTIHIQWPDDVTEVCIEYPFTPQRGAIAALMATVGVITHQAPSYCRVAWVKTADLRDAIGCAKNTKEDAHRTLIRGCDPALAWLRHWTPDELDALVACLGWATILGQQDAA